jgi:anti-sigma factor RsiW
MVDIIHLNDDPHARTQSLLSWYVTGVLEDKEAAEVEAHLGACAECREDFEMETALARRIRTLPSDIEGDDWAALQAAIDGAKTAPRKAAWWRRSTGGPMARAASLAILIPILAFALARPQLIYRTLDAAPSASPGNLIVIFRPDSSEAALRTILMQNQARIVDGPTPADAYVLRVAAGRRAAVLARLRSDRDISLAGPIGGDDR